ncbi:MAG: hypothetical protein OXF73_14255 [Gammaproteobacteria bacterium]|nr:hypothetical protein [Gammaproteobacteria bacterium]MCY4228152.1 hypothetical protein [Gammaproteobacteria bacterium]
MFVANPRLSPPNGNRIYARPDDFAPSGKSWREELIEYNRDPKGNPHGLLPAWKLYKNLAYKTLADHVGRDRLYILSAGWGLIPSDFLTPKYDITFSKARNVERYKRRSLRDEYQDIPLPDGISDPIVFFGGRDYIPLFCKLTTGAKGPRTIYYAGTTPDVSGCKLKSFGKPYTNWQYQCARKFVEGRIG